ncbi:ABC transporter permease [Schaalia sp. ZJ1691]|uniref:ABC transporter permease n=1 Tax=Schaalia sp. ZJ1691 TaxID=2709404 RepID=UPI0013ED4B46|nr:ABC transporter permease [Schaalia sp. ZJ1691]
MTLTTSPELSHETHAPSVVIERPLGNPWSGFGLLTWYSFWKLLTNPYSLGFALALPIFMYFMFGTGQEYSDIDVGNGNVAATVLINMAIYGTIMTVASMGANIALERAHGVSRLFAMTPMSATAQICARAVASVGIATVVITVVFGVGGLTGSRMTASTWVLSGLFIVASSLLPAALGLAAAFAIRSDGAFAVTSTITVFGSFAAGMFIPLDQMGSIFQHLAPWTPFYGISQLVMLPIYGFETFRWTWLANFFAWVLVFVAIAAWAQRRDTNR